VEVVLDNPGNPPAGSFAVANTGGWTSWETIPANISTVTGTHNVYLEFVSGAGGDPPYVSLHYFDFPASWRHAPDGRRAPPPVRHKYRGRPVRGARRTGRVRSQGSWYGRERRARQLISTDGWGTRLAP
jgi:hypothetical protein